MHTTSQWLTNVQTDDMGIHLTTPNLRFKTHQLALLKQPCTMFLPCQNIMVSETHMTLTYNTSNLYQTFSTQITTCTQAEKHLILLNLGKFLKDEQRTYSTSFDPRNIAVTDICEAAFLFRILPDMPELIRTNREEFIEYKTLVLSVVQDKYSFAHLNQYGLDILSKNKLCAAIIDTKTPQELESLLAEEYKKNHYDTQKNRISFPAKHFRLAATALLLLFAGLTLTLAYFIHSNLTETRNFGTKMYIYQSHYSKDPQGVIKHAEKLNEEDMDTSLKKVIADALITTHEPENLKKAFALDPTRQIEIINKLVALEKEEDISTLTSNNPMVQLYIAYYSKDYQRAVTLAEEYIDLRFDAQAQLISAKAYAALGDYTQAEIILNEIGDIDALLDMYKQQRETLAKTEKNIENRKQLLQDVDERIKLVEDIKSGKSTQGTGSETGEEE